MLPHETDMPLLRHGGFWLPGDAVVTDRGTFLRAPMWVEWLAPSHVLHPHPLVLIHGGGGQGTDWLNTPDGRAGWAPRLAEAGFAVYVVDRPGHGRSPHHPAVLGEPGPQMPVEATSSVFAPDGRHQEQTQWPWRRDSDGAELLQLAASSGFILNDFAEAQELDARRLGELIDRIGPAVLIAHSAGTPGVWLAASRAPGGVRTIVAVEPMGPPYIEVPGLGTLSEGLTSVPLGDGLKDLPVLVVTGSASQLAAAAGPVTEFLAGIDARVQHLALAAAGVHGNGHGLIFESNSDDTLVPVLTWIRENP